MDKAAVDRVREALKAHKRYAQVAKAIGVTYQTVWQFARAEHANMGAQAHLALCAFLNLDANSGRPVQASSSTEPRANKGRAGLSEPARLPIVGAVQCGDPDSPAESVWLYEQAGPEGLEADDGLNYHLVAREMFAQAMRNSRDPVCLVKVEGTSMLPEYRPGIDTLLVERTSDIETLRRAPLVDENGVPHWDHVVVDVHGLGKRGSPGQYTLKELRYRRNNGQPMLWPINSQYHDWVEPTDDMTLWGVVIASFRLRLFPDMIKTRKAKSWRK